jgi:hypothetical protein
MGIVNHGGITRVTCNAGNARADNMRVE